MIVERFELELLEPLFFASREIDTWFLTEPVIGNYALVYALGLASSPYRVEGDGAVRPGYGRDLARLNQEKVYVTPGSPVGPVASQTQRWNALSDSYWYRMSQNEVVAHLDGRFGERPLRPSNFPQQGHVRLVARGTRFRFHVVAPAAIEAPPYLRLGKWTSKARVTRVASWKDPPRTQAPATVSDLQNAADLEASHGLGLFDLVAVPPVPLLRNVEVTSGEVWKLEGGAVPVGLRFAFPEEAPPPVARSPRRRPSD